MVYSDRIDVSEVIDINKTIFLRQRIYVSII